MRTIVLYSHSGRKKHRLRFDVVVDVVRMACLYSHGIRDNTEVYAVLAGDSPPTVLYISKKSMFRFPPDFPSLEKTLLSIKGTNMSFRQLIREFMDRPLYVLEEKGIPIEELDIKENPVFILGDHIGLPRIEEKFVVKRKGIKVSLGKVPLLSASAVAVLQYFLDKKGVV